MKCASLVDRSVALHHTVFFSVSVSVTRPYSEPLYLKLVTDLKHGDKIKNQRHDYDDNDDKSNSSTLAEVQRASDKNVPIPEAGQGRALNIARKLWIA